MDFHLTGKGARRAAVPLTPIADSGLKSWLSRQRAGITEWVKATHFAARPGEVCAIPDRKGELARVLAGYDPNEGHWAFGGLPVGVPFGHYRLDPDAPGAGSLAEKLCLGWALGSYVFARYKKPDKRFATLQWPPGVDRERVRRAASAVYLVRDLVNTPTADMGPADLAEAARTLAKAHGAKVTVIKGADLLARNFPMIHAVGRAAQGGTAGGRDREPRLVDLTWGRQGAFKVTLVGKGVCFDSGGLNLKNDAAMKLMKKDMGGAAHVLALAFLIMDAGLDVRLRVLIPAVENSVSGNAMRPLDVIKTRMGLTVEIGNTDAEGRLILCDALAEAASEKPDLLIDCATLTGAARAALGPDIPALFCNDDALAEDLLRHARETADPLWRLPLWRPYREGLKSAVADLNNISDSPYAGAITAALYLQEFVAPAIPWAHLDMMAWNVKSRPGRPEGGEAMGLRALYAAIAERAARSGPKAIAAER
ncbi:MAG: leucyl aminopeptidase family protein, partial [Alphaproteobacteria bacterium]